MPFEAQKSISRNLVLSAKKQTTYGTVIADADLTHRVRFDPSSFEKVAKTFRSDFSRAGKGHPFTTERLEVQRGRGFSFNQELTDWLAGWFWAFALGASADSGPGPYTHVFTPDLSTNIAPVTTAYFEETADIKYKVQDLAINSLKMSGGAIGTVMCSADLVGSGRHLDGAIVAGVPALPTNVYLMGNQSDIQIGAPGSTASIKERVKSWEVDWSQNVIPHYAPGGGLYASFTERGLPTMKFMATVMAKDTDDIRTLLLNDTEQEVKIILNNGAAAQMTIDFPSIYLSAAVKNADGDKVVWQIESDEQAIRKSGVNQPIQVTVINSVAAYLGAG
ncbi:MAG: hypothetical protein LAO06_13275 [Acidobacteriia bacterium]|nr:hypothetical protein [Terriglobia bacterium]